jgi:hypothetical protein
MFAVRAAVLGVLTALATAAVRVLVTEPLTGLLRAGTAAVADRDPVALVLPLDELVLGGAALALSACWLWLLLGVVSGVVSAAASGVASRRGAAEPGPFGTRLGPRWVRSLTAVALGAAVLQGPAYAEPSDVRALRSPADATLSGLPLPDRASTTVSTAATARAGPAVKVRVNRGDSLWSIAARELPPGASSDDVHRAWRRIAAANSRVLGPDPDLIFPGTTLVVPPLDRLTGKEPT